MKICVISDTHTKHKQFRHLGGIPECDVLVHCGDFTWDGKYWEVRNFIRWFLDQPAKHKVLIAGNHELTFDRDHSRYNPSSRHVVAGCTHENFHYLQDSEVVIDGIKFYGTPWTPHFHNWAFNGKTGPNPLAPGTQSLEEIYNKIPEDVQVLLCHGPVYDVLDRSERGDMRTGSVEMRRMTRDKLVMLKLYLCGHIHESRGMEQADGGVTYINASSLGRDYATLMPPIVVETDEVGNVESVTGLEES